MLNRREQEDWGSSLLAPFFYGCLVQLHSRHIYINSISLKVILILFNITKPDPPQTVNPFTKQRPHFLYGRDHFRGSSLFNICTSTQGSDYLRMLHGVFQLRNVYYVLFTYIFFILNIINILT